MRINGISRKAVLCAAVVLTAMAGVSISLLTRRHPGISGGAVAATNHASTPSAPDTRGTSRTLLAIPPLPERQRLSDAERLRLLERNGQVFLDADIHECQLAQKASWWGKPLDPAAFWSGRTLWLDAEAYAAARRHGREWPPIPYKDPRLPPYPDDDRVDWTWATPEGPNIHYAGSSEESAFWSRFAGEHPTPPGEMETQLYQIAREALEDQVCLQRRKVEESTFENSDPPPDLHAWRAQALGCPGEALSGRVFFWAYVLEQRKQWSRLLEQGASPDSPSARRLLDDAAVPAACITEPLTREQQAAANAWKIDYLRRLRSEKTDDSYIAAYLQAWGLSEAEVFGGGAAPPK